jgi:toxin-antitoxin system PIN domain toxin
MTRTVWLLDANMLIAMTHDHHVHHAESLGWFAAEPRRRWATCALTQLAFLRLASNPRIAGHASITAAEAMHGLEELVAHPQHEYWDDAPAPASLPALRHPAFVGHRQVTDIYLLALAAERGQVLATLDRGVAAFAAAAGLAAHVELVGRMLSVQEPARRYGKSRVTG